MGPADATDERFRLKKGESVTPVDQDLWKLIETNTNFGNLDWTRSPIGLPPFVSCHIEANRQNWNLVILEAGIRLRISSRGRGISFEELNFCGPALGPGMRPVYRGLLQTAKVGDGETLSVRLPSWMEWNDSISGLKLALKNTPYPAGEVVGEEEMEW